MGPTQVNGLPTHILLVHFVVAVVPFAAVLVVAAAWWPWARRRLGIATPLVALAALALMPVTMHAGDWLLPRVTFTPLVGSHVALGRTLWPWVTALFVVAVLGWVVSRLQGRLAKAPGAIRLTTSVALALVALVVAVGTMVQVYRVGESGSRAVWTGRFSTQAP
jgi:hypothetical protein